MNADDCDGGALCCASLSTMVATCAATACPSGEVQLCASSPECLDGQTCSTSGTVMGLMVEICQATPEAGSSSSGGSGEGGADGGAGAVDGAADAGPSEGGSVAEDAASEASTPDASPDAPSGD
jgi:hypothetical protein